MVQLPTDEIEYETDQQLTWSEKMDTLYVEATDLINEFDTKTQNGTRKRRGSRRANCDIGENRSDQTHR